MMLLEIFGVQVTTNYLFYTTNNPKAKDVSFIMINKQGKRANLEKLELSNVFGIFDWKTTINQLPEQFPVSF